MVQVATSCKGAIEYKKETGYPVSFCKDRHANAATASSTVL